MVAQDQIEIYNEFSLQHEMGGFIMKCATRLKG